LSLEKNQKMNKCKKNRIFDFQNSILRLKKYRLDYESEIFKIQIPKNKFRFRKKSLKKQDLSQKSISQMK